MGVTATELRKNLFATLESALSGENVEFTYKGTKFSLVPHKPVSRLALMEPFSFIAGTQQEVEAAAANLWQEKEWLEKWDQRLKG